MRSQKTRAPVPKRDADGGRGPVELGTVALSEVLERRAGGEAGRPGDLQALSARGP